MLRTSWLLPIPVGGRGATPTLTFPSLLREYDNTGARGPVARRQILFAAEPAKIDYYGPLGFSKRVGGPRDYISRSALTRADASNAAR